jgi:hypothetical protein
MEESDRRIMWATLGVGMIGSAVAVSLSMATSNPVSTWIFAPLVLALAGVYVFLAALTDSQWFLYPGKTEALVRVKQRLGVAEALAYYVSMGNSLARNDPDNHSWLLTPWIWGAHNLVKSAWGLHEAVLLGHEPSQSPTMQVQTVTKNLQSLIQRTNGLPSRKEFKWNTEADWCTYLTEQFPLTMPNLNRYMTEDL